MTFFLSLFQVLHLSVLLLLSKQLQTSCLTCKIWVTPGYPVAATTVTFVAQHRVRLCNLFINAHFSLATCGCQGFTNWFLVLCAWGLSGLVLSHLFDTPDILIVLPTFEREATCHVHTKPAECEFYMIPFMCVFLGSYSSTCTRRNYPDYFLLFSFFFVQD